MTSAKPNGCNTLGKQSACAYCPNSYFGAIIEQDSSITQHGKLKSLLHALRAHFFLQRDGLMNMCYPHPFDFYFDLDWFKTTFGIQVMLYNRYEEWVHERTKLAKTPPTGQYLLASNADSNDGEIDILRTPISIPAMKLFCYRQAMLDYKPWSPVTMIPPKAYRYGSGGAVAEAYGHYVSETLNSPEWILSTSMIDNNPEAEPQVIVADWHFSVRRPNYL